MMHIVNFVIGNTQSNSFILVSSIGSWEDLCWDQSYWVQDGTALENISYFVNEFVTYMGGIKPLSLHKSST